MKEAWNNQCNDVRAVGGKSMVHGKGHKLAFYDDDYNVHTLFENYQKGHNVQRGWHSQNFGTSYDQMPNFPYYNMTTISHGQGIPHLSSIDVLNSSVV